MSCLMKLPTCGAGVQPANLLCLLSHTLPLPLWTMRAAAVSKHHKRTFPSLWSKFSYIPLVQGPSCYFLIIESAAWPHAILLHVHFMCSSELQPQPELCVSWDCVLTTCRMVGLQPMMKGKLRKPLMRWAIRTGNSLCRYLALLWDYTQRWQWKASECRVTEIEEFLNKHTLGSSFDVAGIFTKMWCPSGDFPEYSRVAKVSRTEAWWDINTYKDKFKALFVTSECCAAFYACLIILFKPGISTQLQLQRLGYANTTSIIQFIELDFSGGCVELFPTCVIQIYPITPERC